MGIALAALALAGCRGDAKQPPARQQGTPPASGRLEMTMALPRQPAWNSDDEIVITIANGSAAPVPDAVINLLLQAPIVALVDSAASGPKPTVTILPVATRLKIPVASVAAGRTVQIRQRIRTPPAPLSAAGGGAGAQKQAPAAEPTQGYLVRARLERQTDGALLAAPAEDSLRMRMESEVVVGGCGNVSDAVVTRYGIGPVRVGMPVDALRAACPEAKDTTWRAEGAVDSGLVVAPGGRRAVAVTAGNAVERIIVDQPGLKTAAGAAVGATVADLRARFGRMCAGRGEGRVAVWFPNAPGLSFGLDTVATKAWRPAQVNADSVPDDVAVTSMWVRKGSDDCPARPGEGGR